MSGRINTNNENVTIQKQHWQTHLQTETIFFIIIWTWRKRTRSYHRKIDKFAYNERTTLEQVQKYADLIILQTSVAALNNNNTCTTQDIIIPPQLWILLLLPCVVVTQRISYRIMLRAPRRILFPAPRRIVLHHRRPILFVRISWRIFPAPRRVVNS